MQDKFNSFKKELRELLEKYNASIIVDYHESSDMHGVYDERMMVGFSEPGKHGETCFEIVDNWGIEAHDLKDKNT